MIFPLTRVCVCMYSNLHRSLLLLKWLNDESRRVELRARDVFSAWYTFFRFSVHTVRIQRIVGQSNKQFYDDQSNALNLCFVFELELP